MEYLISHMIFFKSTTGWIKARHKGFYLIFGIAAWAMMFSVIANVFGWLGTAIGALIFGACLYPLVLIGLMVSRVEGRRGSLTFWLLIIVGAPIIFIRIMADWILESTKKARQAILELGIFSTVLLTIDRALKKVSKSACLYYYLFVQQRIIEGSMLPAHKGASYKFRVLKGSQPILEGLPRPTEVTRERFSRGYVCCIAACKDDKFVGCAWLSLGEYIEDEIRATFIPHPQQKVAWDFDVYIDPEHRASYLFSRLWESVNSYLAEHGYVATASRISGFNAQSLNSHKKLGAEIVGRTVYLKIGNTQTSLSSIFPYFHISFNTNAAPKYKLGREVI